MSTTQVSQPHVVVVGGGLAGISAALGLAQGGAKVTLLERRNRLGGLTLSRRDRPILAWYGDMTFLPHLWRFLRAGGATCEVFYGDPIPVQAAADRKLLARETERAVRSLAERARMGGSGATSAIPAEPKTG